MSQPQQQPRMYDEFAHLWPLISATEDYAEEAKHWRDALVDKLGPGQHEILELGVGGGNNLSHILKPRAPDDVEQDASGPAAVTFKATGVDISDKMLDNSRRLNPEAEHHVGDMRTIRLGRKFKAVLIHDAISYMTSEDDLRATFATAAAHLESGGVFITTPDHFEESFVDNAIRHDTSTDGKTMLSLIEYAYRPDRTRPIYETLMFYVIREGDKVRVEQDRHHFGLFPLATWLRLLNEDGFGVEKRPYDVHDDHHESYLLVGVLR